MNISTPVKLLYTIGEACFALGVKRTTIYKLIKSGVFQPVKIGRRTLLRAEEVERMANPANDGGARPGTASERKRVS